MTMHTRSLIAAVCLALACAPLAAQPGPTRGELPAWEQLDAAQREALIAPVRDRWNAEPDKRTRMLRHAQRWQHMTPEQRRDAHHGMERWQDMSPEHRDEARALYRHLRALPPAERDALRAHWRTMTPEQRRSWLQDNPAPSGER